MIRLMLAGCLATGLSMNVWAQRAIEFAPYVLPEAGALAIAVRQSEEGTAMMTGALADVDARTGGQLSAAIGEAGFIGVEDTTLTLYAIAPYARIDLVGLGAGPVDRLDAEDFGGLAAGLNTGTGGRDVHVLWPGDEGTPGASADRVAFGFRLGDYRFDRYQVTQLDPETLGAVRVLSNDGASAARFSDDLEHLAAAIYLARDLASEPGNVIYPESFVDRVEDAFDGVRRVDIKVLDEDDLERLRMGAHLGVGKGSDRPPRLLIIEYTGGGDEAPLVLAGKGVTFDTGGISLKPPEDMWHMKADLSGAAAVSA
ncbi:MAG: M17 family peptidase N-terminal domain-containing protein, partial [Pseudomonadota bacterium]